MYVVPFLKFKRCQHILWESHIPVFSWFCFKKDITEILISREAVGLYRWVSQNELDKGSYLLKLIM